MSELDGINPLAKSIMQWGPAAIAMILMFIAERKLKERLGNSTGNDHTVFTWLYVGNWLFVAGMLIIVTYFWIQKESNAHKAINTQGYISHVPENVSLYSRNDFYQRISTKGPVFKRYNEIAWHFTNSTSENKTRFSVQSADGLTVKEYYIYSDVDYADKSNIELRYKLNDKSYNLEYRAVGDHFEILKPVPSSADDSIAHYSSQPSATESVMNFLFASAHAEDDVSFSDIEKALNSENPFTRQEAASYLAKHQAMYSSAIEDSLESSEISDRQLWGILSALGNPPKSDGKVKETRLLSGKAQQAVFNALFHPSPAIDLQARKFFLKNLDSQYVSMYQDKCGNIDAIEDDFTKERCGYIGMSVYYNIGISRAISKTDVTASDIVDAIQQMETASDLWKYVSDEKKLHHGKLQYGIALLFEKLAETYEKNGEKKEANKSRSYAVSGFNDFLAFLKDHPSDSEVYSYCWHIEQAECYVKNPTAACINDNPVRECDYAEIVKQESVQADDGKKAAKK